MPKYLLDTNICVFIMRGKYNLDINLRKVGVENCFISEITVAELKYGAECSQSPVETHRIVDNFCSNVGVVPIRFCIDEYAKQKSNLRKKGLLIDDFDLLIACGAISKDFILVSDNTKHFDRIPGLQLQNWVNR